MKTIDEIRKDNRRLMHDTLSLNPESMMKLIMGLSSDIDTLLAEVDRLQEALQPYEFVSGETFKVSLPLKPTEMKTIIANGDEIYEITRHGVTLNGKELPIYDYDDVVLTIMIIYQKEWERQVKLYGESND